MIGVVFYFSRAPPVWLRTLSASFPFLFLTRIMPAAREVVQTDALFLRLSVTGNSRSQ
ncbi:hypothetical protein [uncultured Microbulbifer sp.]|uniref:hypothetical protein n=1 Tax=uncultured Microbulbifer sp. TaxID=348147 RepID=UPI00262E1A3D|nr:hypothetical protein [uncultured Microbulbifer sp.]